MICRSEGDYPRVTVSIPNREYARLLMEDYASAQSEETALHLYLYQAFVLESKHPELARVLRDISKVEMHHLLLLGQVIEALGVNPVYGSISEDGFVIPWSGLDVPYKNDLKSMLEVDIAREEAAVKNYMKHKRMIDDVEIRELLDRIIADERVHLDIFHYYLQELCRG